MMNSEMATFAGGCFWCIEHSFQGVEGVLSAVSGYAGGDEKSATYMSVASRTTAHKEAVQVTFDPEVISYEELLKIFWRQIDPTDDEGQFADRGPEYRTEIMYHDDTQKTRAQASKEELGQSGIFTDSIVTEINPYTTFFRAEEEHQGYAKRCPIKYGLYRKGSGRSAFLKQTWKDKK